MPVIFALALFMILLAATTGFGYYFYVRPSRLLDQLAGAVSPRTSTGGKTTNPFSMSELLKKLGEVLPVSPQSTKIVKQDMILPVFGLRLPLRSFMESK